jgi:sec-independent protein translocase protein TatC
MGEKSEASAESGVADAPGSTPPEDVESDDPSTEGAEPESESAPGEQPEAEVSGDQSAAGVPEQSAAGVPEQSAAGVPEQSEAGVSGERADERSTAPPASSPGSAPRPDLVASEFVAPDPGAATVASSTASRRQGEVSDPYAPGDDALASPGAVAAEPDPGERYEGTEVDPADRTDWSTQAEEFGDVDLVDPTDERESADGEVTDEETSHGDLADQETPRGDFADEDVADEGTVGEQHGEFGTAGTVGALSAEGPESDQEMPLTDHIEEMVRRLGIVFAVGIAATLVVFPVADQLINFLWNWHIPGAPANEARRPYLYGPLELILTELKVAGLAGFIVGLPVLVYQSYRFMRPGLYPRERRYYLAAVPTSLVLALVGVAFAHFVVLPSIFAYFTSYTTGAASVAFGLRETFRLILLLMGYMALVFQIPLFMMLAIMMGLVTRQWLTEKRLLFWGGFAGVSFLISPDPTGMAPIIIAATMIGLFEGTLALLRWTSN